MPSSLPIMFISISAGRLEKSSSLHENECGCGCLGMGSSAKESSLFTPIISDAGATTASALLVYKWLSFSACFSPALVLYRRSSIVLYVRLSAPATTPRSAAVFPPWLANAGPAITGATAFGGGGGTAPTASFVGGGGGEEAVVNFASILEAEAVLRIASRYAEVNRRPILGVFPGPTNGIGPARKLSGRSGGEGGAGGTSEQRQKERRTVEWKFKASSSVHESTRVGDGSTAWKSRRTVTNYKPASVHASRSREPNACRS